MLLEHSPDHFELFRDATGLVFVGVADHDEVRTPDFHPRLRVRGEGNALGRQQTTDKCRKSYAARSIIAFTGEPPL